MRHRPEWKVAAQQLQFCKISMGEAAWATYFEMLEL